MLDRHWRIKDNHSGRRYRFGALAIAAIFLLAIAIGLGGCQSLSASEPPPLVKTSEPVQVGNLREVSPPKALQALAPSFNQYQPQLKIVSPAPDTVIKKTTVTVQLQAEDLPLSNDDSVPLRAHVHLILDNEPYRAIYNLDQPIVLEDLEPGTHTLRAFPVRPWHESYKNDGAYAQVTFHVLTKTDSNNPDPDLPLLTYSRPKGDYGAEPILLDYYLTNAPLHIAAANDPDLNDWRIRVTVNNQSFLVDQWQPVYLEGFETGENWLKLEFIDEGGNLVPNRFNNTVRVINYQPDGQDAFSRLMRGDLPVAEAYEIVGLKLPFGISPTEETEELVEIETASEPLPLEEEVELSEPDQPVEAIDEAAIDEIERTETTLELEEAPTSTPVESATDVPIAPESIEENALEPTSPLLSEPQAAELGSESGEISEPAQPVETIDEAAIDEIETVQEEEMVEEIEPPLVEE
ncbi:MULTISPECIES: hypothetical protein [unclassified Synechocystis]|uniref:hypothetical protein n=1 Tax=unclassified Synechocystis TaxID=2640012 RepID=UPI0003FC810D|nr:MULTISPECIES: hypothetical protein [unclassified Synechocystis]AIE75223.1 hypothetical protein D082_26950 [Synechocystis sp. PCC 6714]